MLGNYSVAAQLVASRVVLSYTELVSFCNPPPRLAHGPTTDLQKRPATPHDHAVEYTQFGPLTFCETSIVSFAQMDSPLATRQEYHLLTLQM
jgi:hypothetical protein